MSERGLLVKLGAVVEGADYYRFLSWRRILFEEFGHELSPETGMEMSHLMPKVAARRLCRALGRLYMPAREDMWMNKLTRYYADYLSEVEEGDVLPRATRIGAYCREEDLRSCVIVPRGEGPFPVDLNRFFTCVFPTRLGEDCYRAAVNRMNLAPETCVLVLSGDDSDLVLPPGVSRTIPASAFDAEK